MRTKRILAFVLCALMLAAFIPAAPQTAYAATSDDTCDSSPDGKHHWEHYDYADCTSGGSSFDQCKYCYEMRNEVWVDALGHDWGEWLTRKAATCTESGTRYHQCTRCHVGETETVPALGHAWDNGKVTKAATCTTEGVKTFTCLRDGSHTRTESIPALGHNYKDGVCTRCGAADPSVTPTPKPTAAPTPKPTAAPATPAPAIEQAPFSGMEIPSDFGFLRNDPVPGNPLRIVTQPEGGFIPRGGYAELTVEAAGGEGEYTYEWWYAPELPMVGTSALTDFLTGMYGDSVATVSQAKDKTSPIAAEFLEAWRRQNGISGTVDHSATVTEGTIASTETETMHMDIFDPLAEKLGTFPEPGCNAWKSGTYWCVVYDQAGHHATSDKVQMGDSFYIAVQPESKNIYGLSSVTLTCRAAGGSGPEQQSYTWYDAEGKVVSDEASFSTDQIGVYHCLVVDFGTNETVESLDAQVYSEERDVRPIITLQPESIELEYREDGQYSWSLTCKAKAFDGDTENLQYQWSGKTNTGWAPIGASETLNRSYDNGTFRCTITDKRNGQYVTSNEVKVCLPLTGGEAKQTAVNPRAENDTFDLSTGIMFDYLTGTFEFTIIGGAPSYTVKVYSLNYHGDSKFIKELTINNVNEMNPLTLILPTYAVELREENGIPTWVNVNISYYVWVEDSLGDIVISQPVYANTYMK